MAQSYLRNPSIDRLPNILEELHTGALCIPPFQRDFTWTGDQRLALFNSVSLGLPSGSLMVWRTSRTLAAENPVGPYRVPSEHPETGVQYLLDGRQRVTTLYASLASAFWTREDKKPPKPEAEYARAPDNTPWEVYYDLEHETFTFDTNAAEEGRLLPLSTLLDDSAYDAWRSKASPSKADSNRARTLRSAFMDYHIPIVPLAVEDIGIVTLTFKRVNNGGTPMADADMARALAWSEGFDLREHLNNVREHLATSGWRGIDEDLLLKIVAVVSDIEPVEVDFEKLAKEIKNRPEVVIQAGERVISAAKLLRERIGILAPTSLPYAQVLVFAARAFHEAGGSLTQKAQDLLIAWVAEVCLDERFGGAPPHIVRAEWRTFARRLALPNAEPAGAKRDERPHTVKECWKFSLAWARSVGTGLVLAAQQPRQGDGKLVKDPGAYVATGSDDVGMLFAVGSEGIPVDLEKSIRKLRGVALRSPANRVICEQRLLPALRRALLRPDCSRKVLASHLITRQAHAALIDRDLTQFFEQRRAAIWEAEQRWLTNLGGNVTFQSDPRRYSQG